MNLLQVPRRIVESVVGWRRYGLGSGTDHYTHTVMISTQTAWDQVALDGYFITGGVDWHLILRCWPAVLNVVVARPHEVEVPDDDRPERRTHRVDDRLVHFYRTHPHIGVCVEHHRFRTGWGARVEFGPFGLLVEPPCATA